MPAAITWLLDLLPTNPICQRLIRGGSTRMRHLYVRSGYLAILMVILLIMLLQAPGGSLREVAQSGAAAFTVVAFGQVALICLLTPIFMAGAIAQEANPRTWDILLTTPLNALQIVLGNLFGRLFFILALLASSLPLFLFAQSFGGIPGDVILLSYLVAGGSALLVAAIAVTLSVTRTAGRRAVFAFYVSVIVYLAVTWLIDNRLQTPVSVGSLATATTVMTPLNPFLTLQSLLDAEGYIPVDPGDGAGAIARWWFGSPVSAFIWLTVGISILLILFSTARLRVIGTRAGHENLLTRLLRGRRFASNEDQRPIRTPGTNPIAWRETTSRGSGALGFIGRWGFLVLGTLTTIVLFLLFRGGTLGLDDLRVSLLALLVAELGILTLATVNLSATAVSREREDGTLDLILTTPIQPGPYLAGKLRGLLQYLWPLLLVPVISLLIALMYSNFHPDTTTVTVMGVGTTQYSLPLVSWGSVVGLLLVLPMFVAFAVMIGLQNSIRSKGTIGSIVAAIGIVIVTFGIVGFCGVLGGRAIPVVGPAMNALSPFNMVIGGLFPEAIFSIDVERFDISTVNASLLVGAVVSAVIYAGIVVGMHASMKKSFMMTVRRLAGTR